MAPSTLLTRGSAFWVAAHGACPPLFLQRHAFDAHGHELGKPFKEIVNSTVRKGLSATDIPETFDVVVRPHDFGAMRPGLDGDRINQLIDDLEVEDYLRKANRDDSAGR